MIVLTVIFDNIISIMVSFNKGDLIQEGFDYILALT